jgi:hypothetical protein
VFHSLFVGYNDAVDKSMFLPSVPLKGKRVAIMHFSLSASVNVLCTDGHKMSGNAVRFEHCHALHHMRCATRWKFDFKLLLCFLVSVHQFLLRCRPSWSARPPAPPHVSHIKSAISKQPIPFRNFLTVHYTVTVYFNERCMNFCRRMCLRTESAKRCGLLRETMSRHFQRLPLHTSAAHKAGNASLLAHAVLA